MTTNTHPGARLRPAASPAVAGFRPVALAMTMASAFAPGVVVAQPSGAQAIHGQATLQQQGSKLTVTTQNGAGTNHSAINWQSFSVPGSTTTHFAQPNAASTSINRVLGNNPSQILGTLSSNGKLVLVNPAGIAVGAGAMVDTAGFTASTLRMSDADALAGRLAFGDGTGGGALNINGHVLARHGDVVLIAPDLKVGADALVQAPNGATLLAAGQKVAVTGRGLEGIQLELQAPADQALNLGTLQGDAVGVFAGQLKHSGAIQATGVSVEGGRVVLKAAATADLAGSVTATKGTVGGSVHATANKVMLRSGAVIDVSGAAGGGEALVGGGWQGGDARIANAQETTIEQGATVRADAIDSGNGGTVVAWSDGATRMAGAFSARGGAASGDGGQVEVSGRYLDFRGTVDTQAANGNKGQLLLDPTNIYIAQDQAAATSAGMVGADTSAGAGGPTNYSASGSVSDSLLTTGVLSAALNANNVTVTTANPSGTGSGFLKVVSPLSWTSGNQLSLQADNGIAINGAITAGPGGVLSLRAFGGSITQTQPITATGLLAIADFGSVTLTNGANAVPTIAGYAGSAGTFSFSNSGALDVGTVGGSFGVGLTNNIVNLTAQSGDLTVSDSVYGVRGSTVTLSATGGAIIASKVEAQTVAANAGTNLSVTNVRTGGSTIAGLTAGSGSVTSYTQQSGNLTINGNINAGTGSAYLTSAGTIQRTFGVITGSSIYIDAASGIGTAVAPVHTAALSGTSYLYLSPGSSLGSAGGYIDHGGDAQIGQAQFANNLGIGASGNLTVGTTVNTGTGAIDLKSGGTLTKAGSVSMAGGSVTLIADSLDLPNTPGPATITANTITVQNYNPGTTIEVGSASIAGAMQIDASEFALLSAASKLHIGSSTSGNLFVGGAITSPATVLSLQAGGNITQGTGATITGTDLVLRTTSGMVDLQEANAVNRLAAHVGSAGAGQLLHVHNSGSLQVASIDGVGGLMASGGMQVEAPDLTISNATINGGSGVTELRTTVGDITFGGTVSLTSGGGILLDPWNTSVINSGTLTLNSTINPGSWYLEVGGTGTLNVAGNVTMPYLYLTGSGVLTGSGSVTVTDYLDWDGGSMTGTGSTILGASAFGAVYQSVFTSRPMVNDGDFALGAGGSIGVGPGFSLQNNGIFTLEDAGGFAGGSGTIVNNGIFRKGVSFVAAFVPGPPVPTTATVDVGSFVNTTAGTVEVLNTDTLVFPGNFANNSGVIALDAGATLDTMGGSLTSSGTIKGNGTLMLGGGTLTNLGKIAPGGEGAVGTLTIQAQTVNLEGGTLLMADITDTTTYDVLQVTGDVVFASGVSVAAITASAPALGSSYDIVRSSSGTVSGITPSVSTTMADVHFDATHVASPQALRLVAALAPAPAPASGSSTTEEAATQTTSLVVQFLAAFERTLAQIEEDEEKSAQANDNLVNDTSCKPGT